MTHAAVNADLHALRLHALRLRYRTAYNSYRAAVARMRDDDAASAWWFDDAFMDLEAARVELLAALEESALTAPTAKPNSHATSNKRLTPYRGTHRILVCMKREIVELLLGRKVTDDEWGKACSLLEAIERHPDGEAVMNRCIERGLSVDATIGELSPPAAS